MSGFDEYIREALRECLLNAVVHKAYDLNTPIQIAVYDDRMEVWNPAVLPDGWTVETLTQSHRSHPYNPSVANVFFRAGEIESWGRGIERVVKACEKARTPHPQFRHDGTGLWTTFPYSEEYLRRLQPPHGTVTGTANQNDGVNDIVNDTINDTVNGTVNQKDGVSILRGSTPVPHQFHTSSTPVQTLIEKVTDEFMSALELAELCGLKDIRNFRKYYLNPALADGSIERLYPDQPNHPKQKYRLTEAAKAWKNGHKE